MNISLLINGALKWKTHNANVATVNLHRNDSKSVSKGNTQYTGQSHLGAEEQVWSANLLLMKLYRVQHFCLLWSTVLSFKYKMGQNMNILTRQLQKTLITKWADFIFINLNENTEPQLDCILLWAQLM